MLHGWTLDSIEPTQNETTFEESGERSATGVPLGTLTFTSRRIVNATAETLGYDPPSTSGLIVSGNLVIPQAGAGEDVTINKIGVDFAARPVECTGVVDRILGVYGFRVAFVSEYSFTSFGYWNGGGSVYGEIPEEEEE